MHRVAHSLADSTPNHGIPFALKIDSKPNANNTPRRSSFYRVIREKLDFNFRSRFVVVGDARKGENVAFDLFNDEKNNALAMKRTKR